jgi:hypothetical protein
MLETDLERQNSLAQTKKNILSILRMHDVVSLDQLLLELNADEIVKATEIKTAIWVLIAESQIELTSEYGLKLGPVAVAA